MEIQNTRSGQSLIEAIIAISLLTVGFIGIAALLSQSLFLTRVVSDQTTATYLAAEGIELAKNLIDHDVYMHLAGLGTGWGSCFANSLATALAPGATASYEFDYTSTDCNKAYFSTEVLQFDPVTGLYGYASDLPVGDNPVPTKFTREIRMGWSVDGKQFTVNSIVRWGTGAFVPQDIDLEDHFYSWRP